MIHKHDAIYKLYPNVVTIRGDIAYDADENIVEYDLQAIENEFNSNQYAINRAKEYPSIADQLDTLYHSGLDAWKAQIKTVKDKYPKA
jgi:hypothetical protein